MGKFVIVLFIVISSFSLIVYKVFTVFSPQEEAHVFQGQPTVQHTIDPSWKKFQYLDPQFGITLSYYHPTNWQANQAWLASGQYRCSFDLNADESFYSKIQVLGNVSNTQGMSIIKKSAVAPVAGNGVNEAVITYYFVTKPETKYKTVITCDQSINSLELETILNTLVIE